MTSIEEHSPNEFVAFVISRLDTAEAEIMRRVSAESITIPDDPIAAMRLLCEYFHLAMNGLQHATVNPNNFAQMLHLLLFHDEIKPSRRWPFSKSETCMAFTAMGLTGEIGEIHPVSYPNLLLLIGSDQYSYTQVEFAPPIEDLRLADTQQARISTEVRSENRSDTVSVSASAKIVICGTGSLSSFVSPDGAGAKFGMGENAFEVNTQAVKDAGKSSHDRQTLLTDAVIVLNDNSTARTTSFTDNDHALTKREVRLRNVYRPNKHLEELTAGETFVKAYNLMHGTDYTVKSDDDDKEADLIAGPLMIQVIACNPKDARRMLNKNAMYSDEVDNSAIILEILSAVRKKRSHYSMEVRCNLILLIDGGMVAFNQRLLVPALSDYSEELAATGFQEIWYTSRVSGQATRLA